MRNKNFYIDELQLEGGALKQHLNLSDNAWLVIDEDINFINN